MRHLELVGGSGGVDQRRPGSRRLVRTVTTLSLDLYAEAAVDKVVAGRARRSGSAAPRSRAGRSSGVWPGRTPSSPSPKRQCHELDRARRTGCGSRRHHDALDPAGGPACPACTFPTPTSGRFMACHRGCLSRRSPGRTAESCAWLARIFLACSSAWSTDADVEERTLEQVDPTCRRRSPGSS